MYVLLIIPTSWYYVVIYNMTSTYDPLFVPQLAALTLVLVGGALGMVYPSTNDFHISKHSDMR